MDFVSALDQMNKGEFVQRAAWKEDGKYLCFMPGMQSIWMIQVKPAPNAGNWLPVMADFMTSDFEIVERAHSEPAANPSADDAALAA